MMCEGLSFHFSFWMVAGAGALLHKQSKGEIPRKFREDRGLAEEPSFPYCGFCKRRLFLKLGFRRRIKPPRFFFSYKEYCTECIAPWGRREKEVSFCCFFFLTGFQQKPGKCSVRSSCLGEGVGVAERMHFPEEKRISQYSGDRDQAVHRFARKAGARPVWQQPLCLSANVIKDKMRESRTTT